MYNVKMKNEIGDCVDGLIEAFNVKCLPNRFNPGPGLFVVI